MTPSPTDSGEREALKEALFDLIDKHFPKGKCKERGQAMVLVAEALMLIKADRAHLLDELEEAGPKQTPEANAFEGGFNQANAAWRSTIQALRTREGL